MFQAPTAKQIADAMRSKGYKIFANPKGYDLNLFGIRTEHTADNTFNDWVGAMYLDEDRWSCFAFPATTDPGLYWRLHPMNVDGTAMLKPGQYRGAYKVGTHKGYPALQQRAPVKVYRDADRDAELEPDESTVQEGLFGINIHRASSRRPSDTVDKWSAGCQVLQDPLHFDFLMALAGRAAEIYGNSFTYTLIAEADFGVLGLGQ